MSHHGSAHGSSPIGHADEDEDAVSNHSLESAIAPAVLDANGIAQLVAELNVQNGRKVNPRDIPTFSGQSHEDADDYLLRYEQFADFYEMNDLSRVRHFKLALQKNALRWYTANRHLATWAAVKRDFLKTFGKTRFDFDLAGKLTNIFNPEEPLNYVFQMISYIQSTSPTSTEADKCERLFNGLPESYKPYFVRNFPSSVSGFVERMRDISREMQYAQKAVAWPIGQPATLQLSGHPAIAGAAAYQSMPINAFGQTIFAQPGQNNNAINPGYVTQAQLAQLLSGAVKQAAAPNAQSFMGMTGSSGISGGGQVGANEQSKVKEEQSQTAKNVEKLQAQLSTLTELFTQQASMQAQRPCYTGPRRSFGPSTTADGQRICFGCGMAGHIRMACPMRTQQHNGQYYRGQGQSNVMQPPNGQYFQGQAMMPHMTLPMQPAIAGQAYGGQQQLMIGNDVGHGDNGQGQGVGSKNPASLN